MSDNNEKGRLILTSVGICTFHKYFYLENWNNINADVSILGAQLDAGSQYRSGARMGSRGIREASTLAEWILMNTIGRNLHYKKRHDY